MNRSDLTMLVQSGTILPEHSFRGHTFVAGESGAEYQIELRNRSHRRIAVALSIDGVNPLTGEVASIHGPAYVINGHAAVLIEGFQRDGRRVASFEFGGKSESYATAMHPELRGKTAGVLAATAFYERRPIHINRSWDSGYVKGASDAVPMAGSFRDQSWSEPMRGGDEVFLASASASASASGLPDEKLGTVYGREKVAPITSVNFDREDQSFAQVVLHYDTYQNLVALGVIVDDPYARVNPYPADPVSPGFAPAPPGWNR